MWPWKKKAKVDLIFRSAEAFFQNQCKYGHTEIEPKKTAIVALVLDAEKEYGVAQPVKREADGTQLAMVRVVSDDGGFVVPARTPKPGTDLNAGDLVMWLPVYWNEAAAEGFGEHRRGWVGVIVCTIAAEFSGEEFKIMSRFD